MKNSEYLSEREKVQQKIEELTYTTPETQAIYQQQLVQCTDLEKLQELLQVMELGERQLYEIQKAQFQTLETYIWKVNALDYLPKAEKVKWVEQLIACDFEEEMVATYAKAVEADKASKNGQAGGWTVLTK